MTDDGPETMYVGTQADATLVEQARDEAEYGQMKDIIERALERFVHGEQQSERERLRTRREEIDDEIEQLRNDRRHIEATVEKKQRQRERIADRLEELHTLEDDYEEKIAQLEGKLYDGARIIIHDRLVKDAAAIKDITPEQVVTDVRERNPGAGDKRFREKQGGEPARFAPIDEAVARNDPADEE